MKQENNFDQHVATTDLSLLAINYAFQNTISWGGVGNWRLKEKDLEEIKSGIDENDAEKTGKHIWDWFRKRWPDFITGQTNFYMGTEFIRQLKRYNS